MEQGLLRSGNHPTLQLPQGQAALHTTQMHVQHMPGLYICCAGTFSLHHDQGQLRHSRAQCMRVL